MGRYIVHLPDIGEGVAEAEIVAWHVETGDVIREDQTLVDIMTDKATVDLTSPVDGIVSALHGEVGDMRAVGAPLLEIEVEGEGNAGPGDGEAVAMGAAEPEVAPPTIQKPAVAPIPEDETPSMPVSQRGPAPPSSSAASEAAVFASPSTRRRALELGIPLQQVTATGKAGRITVEDLERYMASGGGIGKGDGRYRVRDEIVDKPVIGLRRKIAERMQEAKRQIPHITYVEEIDVTELEALRADLNQNREDDRPKLTLLPFLVRALVGVLPEFPQINARYDDDAGVLHQYGAVNVGIATQTPGGLMVPVVPHAEGRDLWNLATEIARVSEAAREGLATREELTGSTITITSLGPLGGISTTPVINHPEVAIIGPNKIVERPVVEGSFLTVRKVMNLSTSFDHRIVDGYDAALFVQKLRRFLEHPALIFMA